MENEQTAVEWLESEFDWVTNYMMDEHKKQVFNKAKAMEKEQHKLTWERGSYSLLDHGSGEDFEQYYKENYGK